MSSGSIKEIQGTCSMEAGEEGTSTVAVSLAEEGFQELGKYQKTEIAEVIIDI